MKDQFDPLASVALVKNFEFAEDLGPCANLLFCVLEGVIYPKRYICNECDQSNLNTGQLLSMTKDHGKTSEEVPSLPKRKKRISEETRPPVDWILESGVVSIQISPIDKDLEKSGSLDFADVSTPFGRHLGQQLL